ncbi:glutamine synthetase [Virgisporangium aliadipatigenens]|uniref:Glutamine synthetase n=1 Tax=Virgisporangium aliadipatigenens TaxID=741659 RepID=A0A8J4DP84_9ACTN|nr:glutamine synthetase family protein [Virgisporangium aliadipatigenens]GIJ44368.1 glutamine synthetase [Virgisporangium aliadipatigenens]
MDRRQRAERAEHIAADLSARGVRQVALTWVDNAGITRVKAVPVKRLSHAAAWGVGMSPVFDAFLVDDSVAGGTRAGGPVGDLRLMPDLDRLSVLAAQPGWAWAPVYRLTQEGAVYPGCQRAVAHAALADAARHGLEFRMAFEVEWFLGTADGFPVGEGPAYGMSRVVELSAYLDDLHAALDAQDVPVDQFHPEYSPGQLELSVGATDPVSAADRAVLVRQTIRAVSKAHGYRVSFAPVVVAGQVGNGQHLHFSVRAGGRALFSGGEGPHGLTADGESVLAGVLRRLPAFTAVGAPNVASYLRLQPQRWAAPWQCWGRENREAALRLVTGSTGEGEVAANAELKCVDGAANPYLVVAAVTAIAAASHGRGETLPPEVTVDPATLPEGRRPQRLPQSLPEAVAALRADDVLPTLFGPELLDAYCAVRTAEAAALAGLKPQGIVEATRWRH